MCAAVFLRAGTRRAFGTSFFILDGNSWQSDCVWLLFCSLKRHPCRWVLVRRHIPYRYFVTKSSLVQCLLNGHWQINVTKNVAEWPSTENHGPFGLHSNNQFIYHYSSLVWHTIIWLHSLLSCMEQKKEEAQSKSICVWLRSLWVAQRKWIEL